MDVFAFGEGIHLLFVVNIKYKHVCLYLKTRQVMKKTYTLCAMLALFNAGKSVAQTLNSPIQEIPMNGTVNASVRPLLHWKKVKLATSYQLKIFKNDTTLVLDTVLKDSVIYLPIMLGKTDYSWMLRAKNSTDSSVYSSKFSFTTEALGTPTAPTLLSPNNIASTESQGLTFIWLQSSLATKYHLQVSSDSTFQTKMINDSTIVGTSYKNATQSFLKDVRYFWRVASINSSGKSNFGYRTFFKIGIPTVPVVSTPRDVLFAPNTNPVLRWTQVAGAVSYCIQVAKDIDFTQLVTNTCNVMSTSYTVKSDTLISARLEEDTKKYFWRIAAVNASGQSAWTAPNAYFTSIVTANEASDFMPTTISVFPNPVTDILTINAEIELVNVKNTSGKVIIKGNSSTIDMMNLANGLYFVEFSTKSGFKHIVKVLKGE